MNVIAASQSPSKKMNPRNRIVLIATIAVLAICICVAIFFDKTKQAAVAANPAIDVSALEKTVAANPTAANLLMLSARYIRLNRPSRAFPYLKALIKKDPGNASAYCDLGVANIMLKNYKQGIDACTKAVQLDPNFQLAKNNLQWGIQEQQKVLVAINELNTQAEDKKDNAYYTLLGIYYFQVGNYDNAIATWQTGVQKFPVNSIVYYNDIGSAQVIQKQFDTAIINFNKVLSIDPNNQLAKNNITWAMSDAAEKQN